MDTVAEFQSRRRRAFRLAGPWNVIGLIGMAVSAYFEAEVTASWGQRLPSILMLFAFFCCVAVGAVVGSRIYRCPNCDEMPGSDDGVVFNPSACPSCGIRLK